MKICPKALLCLQWKPCAWEMHKLTIAAGGLRGIIPQGLAVPSQVQDRHDGSTSVVTSHHVIVCSATERTVAEDTDVESSATSPMLPSILARDRCHRVTLSCTKLL